MAEKYNGEIGDLTVTQSAMGRWLKVSQQRISQLAASGELVKDEFDKRGRLKLAASLKNYYLSKADTSAEASYWKEKALREQINRKRDELKLQREDNSVYDSLEVEMALLELMTVLRTQLLGIPSKMAQELENQSKGYIYKVLTTEIEESLAELSRYKVGGNGNEPGSGHEKFKGKVGRINRG